MHWYNGTESKTVGVNYGINKWWKDTVQMSGFFWCTELCSAYQMGGAGTGCVQGVTAEVLNGGQVGTMIFFFFAKIISVIGSSFWSLAQTLWHMCYLLLPELSLFHLLCVDFKEVVRKEVSKDNTGGNPPAAMVPHTHSTGGSLRCLSEWGEWGNRGWL